MNAMLLHSELKPHKLTVDNVLALVRYGAFAEAPRMELLDGTLYEMSPQTSPHVRAKNRLAFRVQTALLKLGLPYEALTEPTITVGTTHAPEPDMIVCNAPQSEDFFPAASVLLAVEVSISTLRTDLTFKKKLYAEAGIPEYWVVEVEAARIHQFWSPEGDSYSQRRLIDFGEDIASATLHGLVITTAGLN